MCYATHTKRHSLVTWLKLFSIYVPVSVCLCYHGGTDVSLQQIYLPVYLCVFMHAYFCMCATQYAI